MGFEGLKKGFEKFMEIISVFPSITTSGELKTSLNIYGGRCPSLLSLYPCSLICNLFCLLFPNEFSINGRKAADKKRDIYADTD